MKLNKNKFYLVQSLAGNMANLIPYTGNNCLQFFIFLNYNFFPMLHTDLIHLYSEFGDREKDGEMIKKNIGSLVDYTPGSKKQ